MALVGGVIFSRGKRVEECLLHWGLVNYLPHTLFFDVKSIKSVT